MTKLNFSNLPEEIMLKIFSRLEERDLCECELVCRSWNLPAHLLLVKDVYLEDNAGVDSFVGSVMHYPLYSQAVKRLEIGKHDTLIDAEHLERLFSCVMGVENLLIRGSKTLCNVADNIELTKAIPKAFPTLKTLRYSPQDPKLKASFRMLADRMRETLTCIDLKDNEPQYLSRFPRLEYVSIGYSRPNFESWLPLFEQECTLETIEGDITREDEEGFVEKYFESKAETEKKWMLDRLSKLEFLKLVRDECFCPPSIRFISRYLKGLKDFYYTAYLHKTWANEQRSLFCTEFLDIASSLPSYMLQFWGVDEVTLSASLLVIFQKLFCNLPPGVRCLGRIFSLRVYHTEICTSRGLCVNSIKINDKLIKERGVDVVLEAKQDIVDNIKAALTENNITTFKLGFLNYPPTYMSLSQQVLDRLDSVEKVSVELPGKFMDEATIKTRHYNQVLHLELNGYFGIPTEETMTRWISMFPRVKYLKLNYFCGFWKKGIDEYHIQLGDLRLERLYLDTTPIVNKRSYTPENYFLLDIQTLDNSGHYLYQISLDYLRITQLDEVDASTSTEYIRVRLVVKDLQFINLHLYKKASKHYSQRNYIHACFTRIKWYY